MRLSFLNGNYSLMYLSFFLVKKGTIMEDKAIYKLSKCPLCGKKIPPDKLISARPDLAKFSTVELLDEVKQRLELLERVNKD